MNLPMTLRLFLGCFCQIAPFTVLCAYPFWNGFRFSRRGTVFVTAAVILLDALIFAVAGTYISESSGIADHYQAINIIFFFCLLPDIIWYFIAVKRNPQKIAFIFSFVFMSALMVTMISNYITNSIPQMGDGIPYSGWVIPIELAVNIVIVPLLMLFLKKFYIPVENGMSKKEAGYLTVLSLCLCVIVTIVFFISYLDSDPVNILLQITIILMAFVLYSVVFKMYALAHERFIAHEKQLQSEFQSEIQSEQYKRICTGIEAIRKQRHDIQHHMIALRGFLDSGDTQKAAEYLCQYLKNNEKRTIVKFCENPVINTIVGYYSDIAEEQGIDFTVHIDIPDKISVCDTDISVLLGNLLENAVEAARKTSGENRCIKLHMGYMGRMLGITVDNGFDGNVNVKDGVYLSTKSEHSGLGFLSITDIAEKYCGGVEFRHEKKTFYSSVMLGLDTPKV